MNEYNDQIAKDNNAKPKPQTFKHCDYCKEEHEHRAHWGYIDGYRAINDWLVSCPKEYEAEMKLLYDDVHLAEEFKNFQRSKLGRYLYDIALDIESTAKAELTAVEPTDAEAIRKLQEQARIPYIFWAWIEEAILKGNQARTIIEGEVANDR